MKCRQSSTTSTRMTSVNSRTYPTPSERARLPLGNERTWRSFRASLTSAGGGELSRKPQRMPQRPPPMPHLAVAVQCPSQTDHEGKLDSDNLTLAGRIVFRRRWCGLQCFANVARISQASTSTGKPLAVVKRIGKCAALTQQHAAWGPPRLSSALLLPAGWQRPVL